jgi:hypothetical protein
MRSRAFGLKPAASPDDNFILDGGTLDNPFSPATAIQSVARMSRPGGRFLSVNMQSFHSD